MATLCVNVCVDASIIDEKKGGGNTLIVCVVSPPHSLKG